MKYTNLLIACTIATALQDIRPGAEWVLQGTQYEGLTWLDKQQTKPTEKEVSTAISECQQQEVQKQQELEQVKTDLIDSSKSDTERLNALIKYLGIQ